MLRILFINYILHFEVLLGLQQLFLLRLVLVLCKNALIEQLFELDQFVVHVDCTRRWLNGRLALTKMLFDRINSRQDRPLDCVGSGLFFSHIRGSTALRLDGINFATTGELALDKIGGQVLSIEPIVFQSRMGD